MHGVFCRGNTYVPRVERRTQLFGSPATRVSPLQRETLGHFEVRPGGGDFELLPNLSPAELLVEVRCRRAGVAPELMGMSLLAQQPLGNFEQLPPDTATLQVGAYRHAAE